ncbi:MAG: hypothetical protein KGR24_07900 [Planctomycetes bacterium]|nr:hypothetical protein [Planctomycetota bacterium]
MAVADPLEQLQAHIRYRLGNRVFYAQPWRVDELTSLSIRYWPHKHLEAVLPKGRNHAAIGHAMRLVRAQVRETWEARHGIGPMWQLVLSDTVDGIGLCLLDLWFADDRWRCSLRSMARRLGHP